MLLGLKMGADKSRSNQMEELIEDLKTEFRVQQRFTFQDDDDPKQMYYFSKSVLLVSFLYNALIGVGRSHKIPIKQ